MTELQKRLRYVRVKAVLHGLRRPASSPAVFPGFDESNKGRFLRVLGGVSGKDCSVG